MLPPATIGGEREKAGGRVREKEEGEREWGVSLLNSHIFSFCIMSNNFFSFVSLSLLLLLLPLVVGFCNQVFVCFYFDSLFRPFPFVTGIGMVVP